MPSKENHEVSLPSVSPSHSSLIESFFQSISSKSHLQPAFPPVLINSYPFITITQANNNSTPTSSHTYSGSRLSDSA